MKILYLLQQFPKISSEAFILNEMIELQKMGHEVWVLSDRINYFTNSEMHSLIIEYDFMKKVITGDVYRRGLNKAFDFIKKFSTDLIFHPGKTIKNLYFIILNNPYYQGNNIWSKLDNYLVLRKLPKIKLDIVYSPFSPLEKIDKGMAIANILKVPFVSAFRALELYSTKCRREILIYKKIFSKISNLITISQFNKNQLEDIFGKNKKIDIVHSSIDPEKFKNNHQNRKSNKIITIARFVEKKGIIYLLEALANLNQENINFEFVLIGDGPLKETYELKIRELKISHLIKILPPIKQELIKKELAESSILVLPCVIAENGDRDIIANVLKEAMSMEVPVITSDISGIKELINHRKNGILVEEKNVKDLTLAIKELLSNSDLRESLAKEGRKTIIDNFNVKIEAKKLEKIFQENITIYEKNKKERQRLVFENKKEDPKNITNLEKIIKYCDGMLTSNVYLKIYETAYYAQPGNMIELGAAHGAATVCLVKGIINSRKKSILFTVEKGDGEDSSMSKFGSKTFNINTLKKNLKHFKCHKKIKIIPEKITSASKQIIGHGPFSLILIDADGAIDRDFLIFYNFLLPGADIIIDDYENVKHLNHKSEKNPFGKKYTTYLFVNYFLEKGLIEKITIINNTLFCKKPMAIKYAFLINEEELKEIRFKINNEIK